MRALDRKLWRDLGQMKAQALAICLVLACGVATFVMSLSTLASLEYTQIAYYERHNFAQVFASLKRAPESLAARIAEIPGVARVQTRVVVAVTLDVPDMAEPAVGRIISLPERGGPMLNSLHLRRGRMIEPEREGEVLVSEGFADAHKLEPGATLAAVINGRWRKLRIVGVALSPEYIYAIREGDLLPDDRHFGILWMGHTELAAAYDLQGAFNDVALTLGPDAVEQEVIDRLDRLTASYGGLGAYGRADQPSHKFISNEMEELRGMASFVPIIFLGVAAFLLHMVLARLIGTQREQIAALKAFGYTHWEVGRHYLKLVLLLVVIGGLLGTGFGAWLGQGLTVLYTRFFRFPVFAYHLPLSVVMLGLGISGAAAVAGTLSAVLRAVRLPPAEAMRPEPPTSYRPTLMERIGLQYLLSTPLRMILRHLERHPVKSSLACLGIALAVAVLILGNFGMDAIDYVMESQFEVAQRHDIMVTLIEPSGLRALHDLDHLIGVSRVEPFRALPARVRSGHRSRRLGVMGVEPEGTLYRVMDVHRQAAPLPAEGLVLSEKLAEVLDVGIGDDVTLEVLEGRRPVRSLRVVGLVADFTGVAAYLDRRAANRLMEEGDVVSGAFLAVDPARRQSLYAALKASPRVAGVTLKEATLRTFRETIAENLLRMRAFNVIFASIIAFGVVYNSARIALAERSRDLATLRVMGFTRGEIAFILLGELAVLTLAAIPVGMVLGYGLAAWLVLVAYDTELFRIPLIIDRWTYGFAAAVTLAAALLSGLAVRRRLNQLDLVAVLKTRE